MNDSDISTWFDGTKDVVVDDLQVLDVDMKRLLVPEIDCSVVELVGLQGFRVDNHRLLNVCAVFVVLKGSL